MYQLWSFKMLAPVDPIAVDALKRRGNPAVAAVLTILRKYHVRADRIAVLKGLELQKTDWVDLNRLVNLLGHFGLKVFIKVHSEYLRLKPSPQSLVMVLHQIDGESAFSFVIAVNSEIVLMDSKTGKVSTWGREEFERSWWGKAYCSETRETIYFHRWSLRCYKPVCPN